MEIDSLSFQSSSTVSIRSFNNSSPVKTSDQESSPISNRPGLDCQSTNTLFTLHLLKSQSVLFQEDQTNTKCKCNTF